jgi:hypothetical protein
MEMESVENPGHVDGVLNYTEDTGEKPFTYLYEPPAGMPARSARTVKHAMRILDGRALRDRITLDREGFALANHETGVTDFYNPEEVRRVYYPEVERLVKEATGAARVVVFDHNVRCRPMAKRGDAGVREPVKFAHNDYTLKSGPQRVRDLLPDEAGELLNHRYAIINVWRPIRGPVKESPLAVCDARSMELKDFLPSDLLYRDRTGEVYSISFSPNHRWYYIPQMERDEALLLKCYDSAVDGRARFTAHSAFEDPSSPPDAPPRESIEARTLVFWRE